MSLRKRVQRQLEFYLSESNLRRDKFLQQHRDAEGFLSIQLFLRFNKIIQMKADNEKILLESAEKSTLIRVDAEQKKVAPLKWPDEKAEDVSLERTVYIERFETHHDHDSLRRRFAQYGKVNLVSLPRFKSTQQFKGFGFVEFASVDAAEHAVQEMHRTEMKVLSKRKWLELKQALKSELRARQQMTSMAADPEAEQPEHKEQQEQLPEKPATIRQEQQVTTTSSAKRHHLRFDHPQESATNIKKPRVQ